MSLMVISAVSGCVAGAIAWSLMRPRQAECRECGHVLLDPAVCPECGLGLAEATSRRRRRVAVRVLAVGLCGAGCVVVAIALGLSRGFVTARTVTLREAATLEWAGLLEFYDYAGHPADDDEWAGQHVLARVRAAAANSRRDDEFDAAIHILRIHGRPGEADGVVKARLSSSDQRIREVAVQLLGDVLSREPDRDTVAKMPASPHLDVRLRGVHVSTEVRRWYEQEFQAYSRRLDEGTSAEEQLLVLSAMYRFPSGTWRSYFSAGVLDAWVERDYPRVREFISGLDAKQ